MRFTARPPRFSACSSRLRQACARAGCADRARYSARARVAGQGSGLAGNQEGADPTHRGHRVHRRDGHRLGGHGHGDRHGDRRLGDGRGSRGLRRVGRKVGVSHARARAPLTHARCSPARTPRRKPAAQRRARRCAWLAVWRRELGVVVGGTPGHVGAQKAGKQQLVDATRIGSRRSTSRAAEHQGINAQAVCKQTSNAAPCHPPSARGPLFSPADQLTIARPPPPCPVCGPGSRRLLWQSAVGRRAPDLHTQPSRPQAARSWPSR